ncbi:MAG: tetratricopeptide repeat protein [Pseudomonadales bacterium]|nr:tetratricopeptide repeat protein [Pseudomonadales bacterium]
MTQIFLVVLIVLSGACAPLTKPSGETPELAVVNENVKGPDPNRSYPEPIEREYTRALDLLQQKQWQQAAQSLRTLTASHPELCGPWFNLAVVARHDEDFSGAESYAQSSVQCNPDYPEPHNLLGVLDREQGDFSAAEIHYLQALKVNSDYAPAILNLAFLYDLYFGRLEEALNYYQRYFELNPDHPQIENWIIDLKNRMKDV